MKTEKQKLRIEAERSYSFDELARINSSAYFAARASECRKFRSLGYRVSPRWSTKPTVYAFSRGGKLYRWSEMVHAFIKVQIVP